MEWRFAVREDRRRLPAFSCAPGRKLRKLTRRTEYATPFPWEHEIQGVVRQLGVPLTPPRYCLVAVESDEIIAVVLYSLEDSPMVIHLDLMAVAMSRRGDGGSVADDGFAEFLNRALSPIAGAAVVTVEGHIHSLNVASQRFAVRNGFTNSGEVKGAPIYGGVYERWHLTLEVVGSVDVS